MAEEQAEIAALAARVAELERQMALLQREIAAPLKAESALPDARKVSVADAMLWPLTKPAPPPMPSARALPPTPVIPPRPVEAATPMPPETRTEKSLEDRLGSQVFNMIGIVAILVGTSWFLKLAIERGWIGWTARVLIGLVAGAGLVLWSERFRRKGYGAFSYSLKAVGTAILYLSLWAAFQLYHLLPASVALIAMILVTAWNGFMAWSQDAELLAAYGLVGGFATPLLLSTGGDHETFLFTYVAAIDLALVLLLKSKRWQKLLVPAYVATVGYFIGWYVRFFHRGDWSTMDGQAWETIAFALVFFAVFAVVSLRGWRASESGAGEVIVPVLAPLGAAAWAGCALYSVLQDSGQHDSLAWVMVLLAAVCLGLSRVQATAVAAAMQLAAGVVFLTIAIPLKASGHTLTTAWLVEGLVLYWAATRVHAESGAPARVLKAMAAAGFVLGLLSLVVHWAFRDFATGFFNRDLGASLVAVITLGGVVWLASREEHADAATVVLALIGVDGVGILLTGRELVASQFVGGPHPAFASAEFATALVGLAVLAGSAWWGWQLAADATADASQPRRFEVRWSGHDAGMMAAVTLVLFNLLTILCVEREIGALWARGQEDLQRSLALSGFLMLYGAALLAAGFWRRSAFVRWQGLVLLLFTIGKVFLYDISGLSQGYRVVSFLALGALLMAVSFAYQKDWLGLKGGGSE